MNVDKKPAALTNGRLNTMANMIIKHEAVADIGADHALLSIHMVEEKLTPYAIVTEIIEGPYERAKEAVNASAYHNYIEVRKGDGLDIIRANEVATVIIAGMGGDTIADIISRDFNKAESFKRFILQPMSRPHIIRALLAARGWVLNEEKLVYENNRFFIILSYTPYNKPYILNPLQLDVGPLLLEKNYGHKHEYLQDFLARYKRIANKLSVSQGDAEEKLFSEYQDKINKLEAIINENSQS